MPVHQFICRAGVLGLLLLSACEPENHFTSIVTIQDCLEQDGLQRWADADRDGVGDCWDAERGDCNPSEIWCCNFSGALPENVDPADERMCPDGIDLVDVDGDCDDSDATVYPNAEESACDNVDSNCDGSIEDGTVSEWSYDGDHDGYGDPEVATVEQCVAPAGYVADATDCDDATDAVHPAATEVCNGVDDDCDGDVDEDGEPAAWYTDTDGDGYGDDASETYACAPPAGAVALGGDCDDDDAAYNPGADESDCTDPNDYNCDGAIGFVDGDGDAWAACEDCNDADAAVNPGATELCNEIDDDCDGPIDEDSAAPPVWYADGDADTFGDPATATSACDAPPDYVADATDCDDTAAAVNPAATEVCNEIDDNCDGAIDDGSAAPTAWYADADADTFGDPATSTSTCAAPAGYVADATDCDDAAGAVNPAATEVCDGVDNNCDGAIDDGSAAPGDWYADSDADTYGDPDVSTSACAAPPNYVEDASDCDDAEAAVNPAATEVCDGVDNNCDGSIDEGMTTTYYADADGDGFGDATSSLASCSVPSGYVTDATDCDDAEGAAFPGGVEICDDGIDQDCDGADWTGCSLADADAQYTGEDGGDSGDDGDEAGESVSGAGDVNADGFADFLIGAWNNDDGPGTDPGAAYLVLGQATPASAGLSAADAQFTGEAGSDYAGSSVSAAGDFNNDGYADMLIGAYRNDDGPGSNGGAAYLVLGSASPASLGLASADAEFTGEADSDYAGRAVSGAGDFNADGYADLLIGAYLNDDGPGSSAGAVYLLLGAATPASLGLASANAQYTGEADSDYAGRAVAGAGDFDADGYADVIIGAYGNDDGPGSGGGSAYLLLGQATPASADLSTADAQFTGEADADAAGWSVGGAGDFDNDGYADLIIGAYGNDDGAGSNGGAAYLVLGSAAPVSIGLSSADAQFTGEADSDSAGRSVAGAGDVNSDGYDDTIIGAYLSDDGPGSNAGAVYLLLGSTLPASMDLSLADAQFTGEAASDYAGWSVAGAGDVDGSGEADLIIGAYGNDDGPDDSPGAAYLLLDGGL